VFGPDHHVIDRGQYSYLVATVVGSAVIPTMIANAFFMPTILLPADAPSPEAVASAGR